jgi:hypothetical protein
MRSQRLRVFAFLRFLQIPHIASNMSGKKDKGDAAKAGGGGAKGSWSITADAQYAAKPVSGSATVTPTYTSSSGHTKVSPSVTHSYTGGKHYAGGSVHVEHGSADTKFSVGAGVHKTPSGTASSVGVSFTHTF